MEKEKNLISGMFEKPVLLTSFNFIIFIVILALLGTFAFLPEDGGFLDLILKDNKIPYSLMVLLFYMLRESEKRYSRMLNFVLKDLNKTKK